MIATSVLLLLSVALASDDVAPVTAKTVQAAGAEDPAAEEADDTAEEAENAEEADTAAPAPPPPPPKPKFPGQPSPDYRHFDIEQIYTAGKHTEGLALAKKRVAEMPDDSDLYWLIARFLFEIGEQFERNDKSIDKVAHYTEMVSWAEKGLALAPNDFHLRFARGIGNGRLGTTKGVLSSLFLAKTVEADWLATVNSGARYASLDGSEVLPCDAHLALGIFYRLVPDRWIIQVLAGTRGSLDKSLLNLETADRCAPNRIGPMKELAVTQLCIGTKNKDPEMLAKGKATVQAYMKLPPKGNREHIDIKHGKLLLDDPGIACGYSRDGQQDLDTSKLDK